MRRARLLLACFALFFLADSALAEVVRIEVKRRDDFGTHERIIGRIYFAIRPGDAANRSIADIEVAPRNTAGLVEFSSDFMFFQPKDASRARGTVFMEMVNRGIDQSLIVMSDGGTRGQGPEDWDLGDRFVLQQGFGFAYLGWQFDVDTADGGIGFTAPVADVEGLVRAGYIENGSEPRYRGFRITYCAANPRDQSATLYYRPRIDDPPTVVPRNQWSFTPDGCAVVKNENFDVGSYEAVYRAKGSPVAGVGLAAIRDFTSYLKYGVGPAVTTLRENPALTQRVIGFGYSQSARLLREFVRDGFNADERGRRAFDGLLIASAGAGGGSFNHRFSMPGQAGNSVLSMLRPVDIPPFTDDGLLARARAANVAPKIFYTLSSTEYWARAGSLTHTSDDGLRDMAMDPTSRVYFLTGTPHASGPLPSRRNLRYRGYQYGLNFAEQRWPMRALLIDLDEWLKGTEPPPSRVPTIAKKELVAREAIRFPKIPGLPPAPYVPPVFRMDYGTEFAQTRVITKEPPVLGAPFTVLLPQVNDDGNDLGGIALPEVAVPLGTHTGWNITVPQISGLRYLAGLMGTFEPFARTKDEREQSGDSRLSIAERYTSKQDYLVKTRTAAQELVKQRFMLDADIPLVLQRAERMWDALAN